MALLSQKLLDFSIIRILGKQKIPALAEILVVPQQYPNITNLSRMFKIRKTDQ